MNYGEELAYWYLRLNGFFPIVDFVMHGGVEFQHTTDCDVLAVRPPHVFEKVGGQRRDWDAVFTEHYDGVCTVGIICQVKTGRYSKAKLFTEPHLCYAINRLGLFKDAADVAKAFLNSAVLRTQSGDVRIIKLLIADKAVESDKFVCLTVEHIRKFIRLRFKRYTSIKYRDRMFFHSDMLQNIIDEEKKQLNVKL